MMLASALLTLVMLLQDAQRPPIQVDPKVGPDDAAVDECIARGVEFLLRSQNRDGSWTTESTAVDKTMDLRNAQTAFSVYALLKCKLDSKHPAISRAVTYLDGFEPLTTYANGVELLMYGALGDSKHKARMQRDVTQLLEMRSEKGWGYTEERSRSDPSNIQYALLGLRAAAQSGLKVPREIWSESIEAMLKFQETPNANGTVRTGVAAREVSSAGFHYAAPETKATGSMTTTGISVLAMCDEMLQGKVPTTIAADFVRATAEALAWLEDHFAVDVNPDGNEAWKYYYLYGLERMGSLLGLERIGNHLWYKAGATELVRAQASDGSWSLSGGKTEWPPRPMTNANTCFALLFLSQATKVSSGPVRARAFDGWAGEDADADVWLRARASGGFAACISGFSPTFVSLHGETRSLRIVSVEWTIDGLASPKLEDRLGAKFDADTFVLRHAFRTNGKHTLVARVGFRPASAPPDELVQYAVSKPLVVHVRDVLEPWMMQYAQGTKNLITESNVESITATSQYDVYTAAWRACDGLQFHGWVCKVEDAAPRITIELDKPVRAKTLVLSQPNACERDSDLYGRVTKVRVTWNDEPKFVDVDIDADPLKKTVFELPKALMVRRIELAILTRTPGRNGEVAGFAEVELLGPESAR